MAVQSGQLNNGLQDMPPGVISVRRQDAGQVVVGWEIS